MKRLQNRSILSLSPFSFFRLFVPHSLAICLSFIPSFFPFHFFFTLFFFLLFCSGRQTILLYVAMLLKKRVVILSPDVDQLLQLTRVLPQLVYQRQDWQVLYPHLDTVLGQKMAEKQHRNARNALSHRHQQQKQNTMKIK
jgi:hypothetical protein